MEKTFTKVWENCLAIIKDNVTPQSYKTWFEPIKAVKLKDSVLTIQVPSQFVYEYIEEHYITLLKRSIKRELGADARLEYSIVMENTRNTKPYTIKVPGSDKSITKSQPMNLPIDINKNPIRNPFIIPGLKKVDVAPQLNPIYTFDIFIEGDCNRLARSAGFAIAQKPGGTSFNPLFVYGGVGLGKTHLANAIGLEIKNNFPNKTVLYVSSEKFSTQFIEAAKTNTINDFINFYQMIDALIVDDVQFLAKKEKTQDIFFHIFNHLHQNGKQLVFTSDKPPVEIEGIEQRLLSRFKWGLAADLQLPGLETRIAILKRKIYTEGLEISDDVVEYLAYSINSNIRELEGALISLVAQSSLNKKAITLDLAKQMIDKFVKNTAREVSIDYIQKVVCDYFELPIDMIKSKTRKREVVQARQITMFFAKSFTKSSLASIGSHCGGKDHATVLHACKTVNNLIDTDKKFKSYIQELEKKITLSNY